MIWQGLAEAYRMPEKVSLIFTWPKGRECETERETVGFFRFGVLWLICCLSHWVWSVREAVMTPSGTRVLRLCITNRDRAQTGWGESLWQSCVKQGRITPPSRGREGEDRWDWPLCHHSGQYDIANVCVCVYKKKLSGSRVLKPKITKRWGNMPYN